MVEEQQKTNQGKEWYKHGWGLVVAILFFPYFLVWYAWAKSKWSNNVKIAITVLVAILVLPIALAMAFTDTSNQQSVNTKQEQQQNIKGPKDYSNKDAKVAYDELAADGYKVKFEFDRSNNGGFSEGDFQDFVLGDFKDYDKADLTWTVTKQENDSDKKVTLYIEYSSVLEDKKKQANKEDALEKKLSIVSAMTACQQYGKQNYRDFKMHSILGKIAERASDKNTWFLKYTADADGYKDKNMECYVTGTTDSPEVSKFLIY